MAQKIAPGQEPLYVPVRPSPGSKPSECFENVRALVASSGGSAVIGWQMWEWTGVLLEAEFHAVWQSPAGELVDITPKEGAEDKILFFRDESRTYDGIYVDNYRMPLRSDPLIEHFIIASEELFRLTREGGKPGEPRAVSMHAVLPVAQLHVLIRDMLAQGKMATDPCLCGSNTEYSRCHGSVFASNEP
jgi:hypothetical protein